MIQRYKTTKSKRKVRVRNKVKNHANRARLLVTRTNLHIYAQIIDQKGKTVAASSDKAITTTKEKALTKTEKAALVGADIAKKAQEEKVLQVVFDRGYYKYQGRVKALAEAARVAGLEF